MKFKKRIRALAKNVYMHLCYYTAHSHAKTVFFNSFNGQYSDNPRAVSEYLHEIAPEIGQVWVLPSHVSAPNYIQRVKPRSAQAFKAMANASVWVMNCGYGVNDGIYKGKDTFYIQTWHGDRGFKRIGYSAAEAMGQKYKDFYDLPDMHACDLCVSASEFGEKVYNKSMRYSGEMLKVGSPRNDKLLQTVKYANDANRIRQSLRVGKDDKILLYAPTFRDVNRTNQECSIDLLQTLDALKQNGEQWICLIRSHSEANSLKVNQANAKYMDVSTYSDMADLLLIADLLITDYSSCAPDFVLTERPVVLALFDEEEYKSQSRALWFEPEDAGFLVARKQEELNSILRKLYTYDHKKIADTVNKYFKVYETGTSTKSLCQIIIEKINNKNHV